MSRDLVFHICFSPAIYLVGVFFALNLIIKNIFNLMLFL